jgi:ribonuclease P protein component
LNLTFTKDERLCSKKAFENLLKSGSSTFIFPLKIIWKKTEGPLPFPAQIAFSVPKKRFKKANKRNIVKRRLREAYRLNKHLFYQFLDEKEIRLQLLVVYVAPEVMTYHDIEKKFKSALDGIMEAIQKTSE